MDEASLDSTWKIWIVFTTVQPMLLSEIRQLIILHANQCARNQNILAAALENRVRKLCYVSSVAGIEVETVVNLSMKILLG